MIRDAHPDDIEQMLLIVNQVHQELDYYKSFKLDLERTAETLFALIQQSEGIVLVSSNEEVVEGFIIGIVTPFWFTKTKYATDIALCVDAKYRNKTIGYKLLKRFIEEGKKKGAKIISTSLNDEADNPKYEKLIKKMGYHYHGKNYEMDLRE